jgi:hypothetical protein
LDEAMLNELEMEGVLVERVKSTRKKLVAAYENLASLIRRRNITLPPHPKLLAEVDVFKSASTFDEARLQLADCPAVRDPFHVSRDIRPQPESCRVLSSKVHLLQLRSYFR